jgi:hypothetical protein
MKQRFDLDFAQAAQAAFVIGSFEKGMLRAQPPGGFEPTICGLQKQIPDFASQCHFESFEQIAERLRTALAHFHEPLVQLLSLAKTQPSIPQALLVALVTKSRFVSDPAGTRHLP